MGGQTPWLWWCWWWRLNDICAWVAKLSDLVDTIVGNTRRVRRCSPICYQASLIGNYPIFRSLRHRARCVLDPRHAQVIGGKSGNLSSGKGGATALGYLIVPLRSGSDHVDLFSQSRNCNLTLQIPVAPVRCTAGSCATSSNPSAEKTWIHLSID